jgi:hypothetical protein
MRLGAFSYTTSIDFISEFPFNNVNTSTLLRVIWGNNKPNNQTHQSLTKRQRYHYLRTSIIERFFWVSLNQCEGNSLVIRCLKRLYCEEDAWGIKTLVDDGFIHINFCAMVDSELFLNVQISGDIHGSPFRHLNTLDSGISILLKCCCKSCGAMSFLRTNMLCDMCTYILYSIFG